MKAIKKNIQKNIIISAVGIMTCVLLSNPVTVNAASFDPIYYGDKYSDVTDALGTAPEKLLDHYLTYGIKEGRIPYEGAEPGEIVDEASGVISAGTVEGLVPIDQLANRKSIQKKMTDEQFAQAYNVAAELVKPYVGMSREDQLLWVTATIRKVADEGVTYSMSAPHYNDPYGFFCLNVGSCAGATRALGLCLNILGIPYEHVNENKYDHQWCRVAMEDETYWVADAYGAYCCQEPSPYVHPMDVEGYSQDFWTLMFILLHKF